MHELVVADDNAHVRRPGSSRAEEHEIAGREMALVDQGPRSATVRAISDSTIVLTIDRQAFMDLCEANHHLGYIVMRNMAADLSFKLRHRNLTGR